MVCKADKKQVLLRNELLRTLDDVRTFYVNQILNVESNGTTESISFLNLEKPSCSHKNKTIVVA